VITSAIGNHDEGTDVPVNVTAETVILLSKNPNKSKNFEILENFLNILLAAVGLAWYLGCSIRKAHAERMVTHARIRRIR
jgi:hypothetical protein